MARTDAEPADRRASPERASTGARRGLVASHGFVIAVVVSLLGTAPAASAEHVATEIGRRSVEIVFDEVERAIIREYFGERAAAAHDDRRGKGAQGGKGGGRKGLPPGLAKKERLPPGLERQLERDGRLPPGLEKRALPGELEARLGPPPDGYERVIAAGDVLLVEVATGVIRDIVRDALD